MRILHIISQIPNFTGSGKYLQAIMKCASLEGHESFLVAGVQGDFRLDSSIISDENCRYIWFDGKDLDFPVPGMSDVMPYQSSMFSKLSQQQLDNYEKAFKEVILKAVQIFQPDILHSHHLWIASATARNCVPDLPMVTTCHSTCLRQFSLCAPLGQTMSPVFRKIDGIMALSNFQKQEIVDIHGIAPEQIEVVGGGYDDGLFYHTGKSSTGLVEILYAGKLSRSKGVPWLLQALQRLDALPWRLHLVGDGSGGEKRLCLQLAEQLGDRVVLHGSVEHASLAALMRKVHIFILPSFSEGLPLVLMEALASGCRLITTSLPGIREILGGFAGKMIQMLDIPELETVDAPYEKDLPYLEDLLVTAIRTGIAEVEGHREPDMEVARQATAGYTWPQVFAKVEGVYERALFQRKLVLPKAKVLSRLSG